MSSFVVLAIAIGDEPLYNDDAGSPAALASYFTERTYGRALETLLLWADAVNNFPYFAFEATTGGNASTSWNNFIQGIDYFESIANGRPILVTQLQTL
ncbi:hypothetical protein GGU11DRAFT_741760 [Lentinula aff. detonsa]|uniref:Uncharacterized protein n=1 Tax=Lentinula detonsa TaxID=2804962 RepID=A0AA38Q0E9_9AGAR|nr:hypothetical protein GGU11DRAFT_741760 [Lentinula aff. detonsa]KAJ3985108.1 hypothetical protein F5890DRAFT_1553447 [Lentinula detonsa]